MIGGEVSFDCYPIGWDKSCGLSNVIETGGADRELHFFGDKCYPKGNDYEAFMDERTIGHGVVNPDDTIKQVREVLEKNFN